ncbi:hypothetical protein ACFQ61_08055 [Streptomyces sp. NPDC056500]|uniref:hypothetical protein n=1 Tax=Streptomyces sp. NPDC056500 TaxID=3345840 RepID=UPI00368AEF03
MSSQATLDANESEAIPHPLSIDPFIPPIDWKLHTIRAFETRLSVCAQEARRMPMDAVYLLPAIEKLPRWAHAVPAVTEFSLMSIERITGCIDSAYFEKYASRLRIEPWGVPAMDTLHYPWNQLGEEHAMTQAIDPHSMLIIARISGSSSSRRQQRCEDEKSGEALILQWAAEGYNVFWTEVGEAGLSKPFAPGADGTRVELP